MAAVHAHGTGAEMSALDVWDRSHLSSVASMTAPEPAGNALGGPGAPSLKYTSAPFSLTRNEQKFA
jgi:hypothetical protein